MIKKHRIPIILVIVSVSFLILAIYNTFHPDPFAGLRQGVFECAAILRDVLRRPLEGASNAWKRYVFLVGVAEENRKLRRDIDQLTAQIATYREAYEENLRLRKLLELEDGRQGRRLVAQVVGLERKYVIKTMIINRGTAHGVSNSAPVITDRGLVGRVVETSWHASRVLLIIDETSNIDAIVQSSRVQGIVQGTGNGCIMKYVGKMEEVKKGDAVVTSGISQTFPKGLLVGYVESVDRLEGGMFQKIELVPAVLFSRLEEVIVLLPPERDVK